MRLHQFVKENRWYDTAILVVYIMAFTGGTCNHVADLLRGGLFPYSEWYNVPESFNLYWTSLTMTDPLAIVMLLLNVRAGLFVALFIMLTDVPINLYVTANYWQLPVFRNCALLMQAGFLLFLLITTFRVWRLSGKS